jgi:hypothetical protein
MNIGGRLDRVEKKMPPPRPPGGGNDLLSEMLTTTELKKGRDELKKKAPDAPIMAALFERAIARYDHFAYTLWDSVRHNLQVPAPWSVAAEWIAVREALRCNWRHRGECLGIRLDLDTAEADAIDLNVVAAVMSRGLYRGARIAAWEVAVYKGTPDEIASSLAQVRLNGQPMTLDAIGLDSATYPWEIRREWETRGGNSIAWRHAIHPMPAPAA